ncbi:MAG: ABC transporter permease, partial [Roseovarius sp.]|nr:ABC transporter permease [Roseovarius sp.]
MTDAPEPITALTDPEPTTPPHSQWRDVWDQFKTHRGALVGTFIFFFIMAAVFVGPWLWGIDATFIDIRARNQGPSWAHPFGTDQLGRDTLARMM